MLSKTREKKRGEDQLYFAVSKTREKKRGEDQLYFAVSKTRGGGEE